MDMIRTCYSVVVVSILVIFSDCLVYGEVCTNYNSIFRTTCDSAYECCDNNTRCCASGLSLGAIIGIVFGVLFMLTICFVCALIVSKKKKKNNVIRASFPNNPNSTVTIANVSNNVNGLGASSGLPMTGHYGYGFSQPPPHIPGMMHVAPPPYSQCVGPPSYNQPVPHVQPLVAATQPGMPFSSSGPTTTGPLCGPLAPAYMTPARPMFKMNSQNITHQ